MTLVRARSIRAWGGTVGVVVPGVPDRRDQRFPEVALNDTALDHLLKPDLFRVRALILNRELIDTLRTVHFLFALDIRQIFLPILTSEPVGAAPRIVEPNCRVTVMFTLLDLAFDAVIATTDGRFATFFEAAATAP
jgi:hypothetical protein